MLCAFDLIELDGTDLPPARIEERNGKLAVLVNTPPPKGGGFRLRLKAGSVRHAADSSHIEVVVWFGWRLVLHVLDPYLVNDVSAACYPVPPGPEVLAPVPFAQ